MRTLDLNELQNKLVEVLLDTIEDTHVRCVVFGNRVVWNIYARAKELTMDEDAIRDLMQVHHLAPDEDMIHTCNVSGDSYYNHYFNIGTTTTEKATVSLVLDPDYQEPNTKICTVLRPQE